MGALACRPPKKRNGKERGDGGKKNVTEFVVEWSKGHHPFQSKKLLRNKRHVLPVPSRSSQALLLSRTGYHKQLLLDQLTSRRPAMRRVLHKIRKRLQRRRCWPKPKP